MFGWDGSRLKPRREKRDVERLEKASRRVVLGRITASACRRIIQQGERRFLFASPDVPRGKGSPGRTTSFPGGGRTLRLAASSSISLEPLSMPPSIFVWP